MEILIIVYAFITNAILYLHRVRQVLKNQMVRESLSLKMRNKNQVLI